MAQPGFEGWAVLARGGHAYVAVVRGDELEIRRDRKLVGRGRFRDGRIDELEDLLAPHETAVSTAVRHEIEAELRTGSRGR
jgi:hypothetical protein